MTVSAVFSDARVATDERLVSLSAIKQWRISFSTWRTEEF